MLKINIKRTKAGIHFIETELDENDLRTIRTCAFIEFLESRELTEEESKYINYNIFKRVKNRALTHSLLLIELIDFLNWMNERNIKYVVAKFKS